MDALMTMIADALRLSRSVLREMCDCAREEVKDEHVIDISTTSDRVVSRALIDFFKNSGIPAVLQSEESGRLDCSTRPEYLIAFDDLDGTDNFFRGDGLLPYCTVISILRGSSPRFMDTVAAGIIEHRTGATWLAEKGKGATLNGTPACASKKAHLDRRTLVTIDHYASGAAVEELAALHRDAWVKDFGSAALHLAGVSSGLFDAFVSTRQKGHEIAAGYLLINEAGGVMTDFSGQPLHARRFDFNATYEMIACCGRDLCHQILDRVIM